MEKTNQTLEQYLQYYINQDIDNYNNKIITLNRTFTFNKTLLYKKGLKYKKP